jgi:hypothetical protein
LIRGTIPARHTHAVGQCLPDLTHGEGHWWFQPAGYRALRQ